MPIYFLEISYPPPYVSVNQFCNIYPFSLLDAKKKYSFIFYYEKKRLGLYPNPINEFMSVLIEDDGDNHHDHIFK